jgi:hypothetical protein
MMGKRAIHTDSNWTLSKEHGAWECGSGPTYDTGEILLRCGVVLAYAEDKFTSLRIIRNGRVYYRAWHGKRYSRRGMVTKAREFAKDVARLNPEADGDWEVR